MGDMEDFTWITIPKKLKEFRMRFNVYDRDQNGIVKLSDLLSILREMRMTVSLGELRQMMANVELEKEDIHFDEFLMMAAKREVCDDSPKELKEAFKVFDNGKGYISVKDLRTVMLNMGERMSEEEVEEMVGEAKVNDGLIKISEFITVLCR